MNNLKPDPKNETPINVEDGSYHSDGRMHNYYVPDLYFNQQRNEGSIYLREGQRAVAANEDFIVGLHSGLAEELDDASNLIMYKCGKEWAQQDMKRFNNRMRHEFGGGKLDIWQMKMRFVFETWWWPLTVQGWGGWTLDLSFQSKDVIFVEIRNSAVAQAMEQVGKPVCHLYAGMFSGVFSYYNRDEQESIEVQCYAMGNDCCKFMVGGEKQINAAEFWRQEGATAEDIRTRI
ncbi:V4R domain-containing protein [Rubellicoccus peritrichatus]|uniref:V4R domain-containing protein n=1 Tax=Rubellicoccus peritrichatus TaxID=3080537 RepID=A0AAQ3QVY2_9BACT|nr:V4R domain-containing protein [Puniceicoccus sp. CR14]WOO41370.1 V4R domain-containing protein [Puniceicoccus sp. CR14]